MYREQAEVLEDLPEPEFNAVEAAALAQEVNDEKERLYREKVESIDITKVWDEYLLPQIESAAKLGQVSTHATIREYFFEHKGNPEYRYRTKEEEEILDRVVKLLKCKGFDASVEPQEPRGVRYGHAYQFNISWDKPQKARPKSKSRKIPPPPMAAWIGAAAVAFAAIALTLSTCL
jgi:hypothetical protein